MPEYDKMTIEESLAQLNEDFDDSEWQQNLFIEYAKSQSKEYQDLVFGRNAELTEKKDTPSEDTPQQSVNFNFGDIIWGFSEYKIAAPKHKTLYDKGERRLGFVINYDSKSVTCLQIVSADNKDRYNKNIFAIKIKDYDPNHPTQEGFVLCNKVFVSPLEYEYPAVDPKTKKFMEINGNWIIIQEHVRGNDFFKLPQKYKDEVYNKLKEFNGSYHVPKLSDIRYKKEDLNEEIRINDTLNKDLWDDNNKLKEEVRDKLLDIADAFLDDLKEDKIDIQVKDIRLLGSNANYNYTDKSDLDLHIVAEIDQDKYEQQLYNCYKTIFNSKYDIKIKGREVEIYVEDVKTPAKSNGVYSILTDEWIKKPKKELIPSIDYEEFEKEFDEWEDTYFDLMDDLEELGYDSKSFPMEEKLICESAELWDLDWYRAYNKNYDIFSTNNSYGGKDAYTWATNDLDYLDFIEDDEKVAKLKLKPCKLLFYNMTKDELDRLQDKYGKTIGKNWEYFDTVNPGDDEMNILNQEEYDGFYDSVNIYVKKEFLEVIDDNIQLTEKIDESLKEELIKDDKDNQCYAFFTPNQLKTYLLNQKDSQRFFIDENLPIYLGAAAFTITHLEMIDLAREQKGYDVKFNEYEPKQICCQFVPESDDYFEEEGDAINDGYDTLYEYEEGYKVYSRENDFEKFSLCKLLGNYKKKNLVYTELKDKDGNHLDGMFVFEGKNTLKEKIEKILDYGDKEDDLPKGYVISTDDEMLKFLKDYESWEQFKIVYDPVENWYLVGDPWDVIHQTLIDAAVDSGFYDPERREVGKDTEWDSIYDAIMNSTNQIYINFDADAIENYPYREVFEFDNAPMYVYSYHANDIDEVPFLNTLKKLDENCSKSISEEYDNEKLIESKQDKENFKKWLDNTSKIALANTNYSNYSIEANADFLFNWFEQHRGELKSPQNDYYYWIKQDYAPGAYLLLNRIASEHGEKAAEEKKAKEGAKLLYSDKDWKVYEITNYEASAKYGKGTKWCISGSKRWANGENGRGYFNDYAEQGIKFYFFINTDGHKYALAVYPDNNFEVFNDEDVSIAYIPDAPVLEEIPVDYYNSTEERIFKNLLFSNQLPNDLAEKLIISAIEDQESYYISDLNDLVHTLDEWIPDGWMEYEAVANGKISKEDYERITGVEYDEYSWDGDYPQISPDSVYSSFKLTDNNCLITKNNLINGVKQAYKKLYPKYMFTTEGFMGDTEIRLLYAYLDLVIFGVNVVGEEGLEKYCYYELREKARNSETLMKKLNDLGLSKDFLLNSTIYSDIDYNDL